MRRVLLAAALAACACSRGPSKNYRNCLKLRVGMTAAEMEAVMGPPAETIPFVEGKSLEHLRGRTAYEWPNRATMSGPNHVSVSDATGRIESVRCSDVRVTAEVFAEPPEPAAPSAPAPR